MKRLNHVSTTLLPSPTVPSGVDQSAVRRTLSSVESRVDPLHPNLSVPQTGEVTPPGWSRSRVARRRWKKEAGRSRSKGWGIRDGVPWEELGPGEEWSRTSPRRGSERGGNRRTKTERSVGTSRSRRESLSTSESQGRSRARDTIVRHQGVFTQRVGGPPVSPVGLPG